MTAQYYVEYNMRNGGQGEYSSSLKMAIRKGYGYLKKYPTSKAVLNILKISGKFNERNVGTMYWSNVNGKRRIVFDSSDAAPGYVNLVNPDGSLGMKHRYDMY